MSARRYSQRHTETSQTYVQMCAYIRAEYIAPTKSESGRRQARLNVPEQVRLVLLPRALLSRLRRWTMSVAAARVALSVKQEVKVEIKRARSFHDLAPPRR